MSEMHDTCNCANAAARLLGDLKRESGVEELGAEAWAALPSSKTKMLDFLCANHTRNLPVDAFVHLFEKYLNAVLGDEFVKAAAAAEGTARIAKDGKALIRAICKLAH